MEWPSPMVKRVGISALRLARCAGLLVRIELLAASWVRDQNGEQQRHGRLAGTGDSVADDAVGR
jgi:hypothetical protein